MGHSKEHMLTTIAEMRTTMKDALEFSKVKDTHLVLHDRALELPAELIREGFNWLKHIFEHQYKEYIKVRLLLSDDQWARYLLWEDFEDFREVVLLRKATFEFRRRIVSRFRPNLFKKVHVSGQIKAIDKKKKANRKKSSSSKRTAAASGRSPRGNKQAAS